MTQTPAEQPHTARPGSRRLTGPLIEIVVVVLSILIAFGLDSWWDGQKERAWEEGQLAVLAEEFEQNLQHSVRIGEIHTGMAERLRLILDWAAAAPEGSTRTFTAAEATTLVTWRTSEFTLGSLDALLSSGDIGRLSAQELRSALAGWRTLLSDVEEKETLAREFVEFVLTPALSGQGFISRAYQARPPYGGELEGLEISLRASPELADLVSARIGHERMAVNSQGLLEAETRRVLGLLR